MTTTTDTFDASTYHMIYVEGGTFQMGSDYNDRNAEENERPPHDVTLSSFYIGKHTVIGEQWKDIMGINPSKYGYSKKPVDSISWYDCIEFCNALSRKEGYEECYTINGENVTMDMEKSGYRLPTEAEWEFAARGGNKSEGYRYAGDNIPDYVAWYGDNSFDYTQLPGRLKPNELEIYDMSGNVFEWCWDLFGDYSSDPQNNPTGSTVGSKHVVRGGSYYASYNRCRVTYRSFGLSPTYKEQYIGLRLTRRP